MKESKAKGSVGFRIFLGYLKYSCGWWAIVLLLGVMLLSFFVRSWIRLFVAKWVEVPAL